MQFKGKLTKEELDDVRRVVRSKWYWLKLLLANWYGLALVCILLWAAVAGLLGTAHPKWSRIGLLWLIIFAFIGFTVYRTRKRMVKEFHQLNSTLPDSISIVEDGVKLNGPNGATGSWPWSNFKGWREGGGIMLLDLQTGAFVIVPVTNLSDVERQSMRHFVQLHIAPPSAASGSIT